MFSFRNDPGADGAGVACCDAVAPDGGTLDLSLGNVFQVTLGANATFVFNNPAPSGYASSFSLYVKQDATGNRTVAWPTSVRWSGGKPAASTGANSIDLYVFEDGLRWTGPAACACNTCNCWSA